ncbi:MAG TPA: 30S ribosomal protein S20 [Chloroflexi bacterium]|nr:30S ribosomal protein S20 [Chloroflexota bacterium]HAL25904.1 30S ribosomal protein S20 [Chloroflexota bacterium]
MAKKKRSALKRIRQAPRRAEIKVLTRSSARTAVKSARAAIDSNAEGAADAVRAAASALDKAVKRGGIHKNAAARKKSRLAKRAGKSSV